LSGGHILSFETEVEGVLGGASDDRGG
jgi:hypothetical protein